jgi:hypothetical protein
MVTLTRQDDRFRLIGSLFQSGTVPLIDALAEFADASDVDFETGDGMTAYFRSRGMIDAETASLSFAQGPLVGPAFLIAGRIEVGALLDLIAAYLDAMEVHFTLFGAAGAAHAPTRDQVASANA